MILFISLITLGYILGVLTTLYIFPPQNREIELQEFDADEKLGEISSSYTQNSKKIRPALGS